MDTANLPVKEYLGRSAIVIGGSIAGMLTARVLSEFYEEVQVFEKDLKGELPFPRNSVPQGTHGHVLLKSGEEILDSFFPGIVKELIRDGSVESDFARDISWNHHGKWRINYESGFSIILQSRPFLEWHIRRRLDKISNIKITYGAFVQKLLVDHDSATVKGIEVVFKNGTVNEITGNLVIDASGAGSKAVKWLNESGFETPKKSEVKVNLSYASRVYRSLSPEANMAGSLLIYPNPPFQNRGGGIYPIENKRWMVTLLGYGIDSPPRTDHDFLEHAKNLEKPDLYHAIEKAVPDSDITVYRFPYLRRFHYEKLTRFPNGLIVIGDAFARIDPVFGQGMSLSALEAMALKNELQQVKNNRKLLLHISKRTHIRFSKILDIPWLIALSEDFRFSHTFGKKPFGLTFLKWYVKKVILACSVHSDVYRQFIHVLHLKSHPITLFHFFTLKKALFLTKNNDKKDDSL